MNTTEVHKPWPHRYLLVRNGSIEGGHGTINEAHTAFRAHQKATPFRIAFGEVIDTWSETGVQTPVTSEDGRVLWYRWDT